MSEKQICTASWKTKKEEKGDKTRKGKNQKHKQLSERNVAKTEIIPLRPRFDFVLRFKEILANKHSFLKPLQRFQVDNSFLGFCFYYLRISKFPRARCSFLKAWWEILTSLGSGAFLKCSTSHESTFSTLHIDISESRSVKKTNGGQIV